MANKRKWKLAEIADATATATVADDDVIMLKWLFKSAAPKRPRTWQPFFITNLWMIGMAFFSMQN